MCQVLGGVSTGFCWRNLKELQQLRDLVVNGRVILKVLGSRVIWFRLGQVPGDHGNGVADCLTG